MIESGFRIADLDAKEYTAGVPRVLPGRIERSSGRNDGRLEQRDRRLHAGKAVVSCDTRPSILPAGRNDVDLVVAKAEPATL